MPEPKHPISIGVKTENGLSVGEWGIKVTNLTSGGTLRGQAGTGGEVLITTPPDYEFTWKNGDKVSIESNGRVLGSRQMTIVKGAILLKSLAATTTKADALPAVDL